MSSSVGVCRTPARIGTQACGSSSPRLHLDLPFDGECVLGGAFGLLCAPLLLVPLPLLELLEHSPALEFTEYVLPGDAAESAVTADSRSE
eukprot:7379686-Prymnesium_polylepis.1